MDVEGTAPETATGRAASTLRGEGMSERTRVRLRALTQWLHLSAMAGLVGSAVLLQIVVLPYVADPSRRVPAEVGPDVVDLWYSVFPWVGAAVFIVTGVFLFLFWLRDAGLTLRRSLTTTYVKLLLVKIVLANAALGIGMALGLSPTMAEDAGTWLAVTIALVVVIVLISATLRRLPLPERPRAADR